MPHRITVGNTNLAILRGDEDVADWDDEELQRGQRRNKNGKWTGRPPKIIPKAVHDELVRRTFSTANQQILNSLEQAVATVTGLLTDPAAEPAVRLKAATFIIERVMGKTPERISLDVGVKAKWQEAMEASVVSVAHLAIEADSWEEAEDDGEGRFRD